MNEPKTRAEHINPALKAAGWGVVEGSRILREYHITPGRIEIQERERKRVEIRMGVDELDIGKLAPLLKLGYHDSIPDAVADLGANG